MTDKEYYTNGQVFSVIYDGVMTLFYKSGKVKARGGYSNGYKEGKWEYFKEDGTLWQIGHLVSTFLKLVLLYLYYLRLQLLF